ncbi:hypothetical protein OPT61_g6866 [Boeremia exigua]|uniref:Uncharacterized protein n=1 Tax=Boeremia exigua TaxID=749465 RepID=A0ACC2I520_9PLEO|nr:hypothetical protein OPT61_g6866 [Boeremia exigua]
MTAAMHSIVVILALLNCAQSFPLQQRATSAVDSPFPLENFEITELPLPPVAPSDAVGSCTTDINPHKTGCIFQGLGDYEFQSGDFTPDGNHVVATVKFVGAPGAPDPAAVYNGEQLILIKADGTSFGNGDPWKCLTCEVPDEQKLALDPQKDYPHVYRDGTKVLWGHNVLDCGGNQLASDDCSPAKTHIYPLYWPVIRNGAEVNGSPRELRLHPDDTHLGWSSFTDTGGQNCFVGRLVFVPSPMSGAITAPRFDLENVNILHDPSRSEQVTVDGTELKFQDDVIGVGELRGWSGNGEEIIYIGPSREANNIDVFAVHVITGSVRRLTQHPEYTDPVAFSADNKWMVVMDTRGSNRQMFMSGMRYIPPLIDLVTITVASSTRNNGNRRFFQPILIDSLGDRGSYFGQQINAAGDGSAGAVNDPNWNGRADPAFSRDGTKIVYWQAIVTGSECGGSNPLPCPIPTTQGQREYRLMLAHRSGRTPVPAAPVFQVPDQIPWALPFSPGSAFPSTTSLSPGNYTLRGKVSGTADVRLIDTGASGFKAFDTVAVEYKDFSDVEGYVLSGWENVTAKVLLPNPWDTKVDWYSDITQTGVVSAKKKTSPGGFHLQVDAVLNIFNATGSLTTTIDGVVYEQPANNT